jgi:cysteine desulfurase
LIYLDNSATTKICDAAKEAIISHFDDFGNPSSSYEFGRKSKLLIEDVRERIAKCINAEPDEIFFTSGGSESNTLALNKYFSISTPFEHHSVQAQYKHICIDKNGFVDCKHIEQQLSNFADIGKSLKPNLLSCMYVNNEIGTIQPIKAITNIAHKHNILVHTDATQAVGHIPVNVKDIGVDMLTASAHKFGGIKGTGFLFAKKYVKLWPVINGGKQEMGVRPGTENVLGIIAMAAALEDSIQHMEKRTQYVKMLRDKMLTQLLAIDGAYLNGSFESRVASNINIRFDGVQGQKLVTLCDLYGICISSGSACNEGNATPSHVLKTMGLSDEEALNSIRITIGHENTEEEINYAANIIIKLIERIRVNEE